jgi:hypothetical protein
MTPYILVPYLWNIYFLLNMSISSWSRNQFGTFTGYNLMTIFWTCYYGYLKENKYSINKVLDSNLVCVKYFVLDFLLWNYIYHPPLFDFILRQKQFIHDAIQVFEQTSDILFFINNLIKDESVIIADWLTFPMPTSFS